jgi:hypothetical protein
MSDAEFLDHLKNEPDISDKDSAVIGLYTIVISVVFFTTVFALFTYFQWELDRAREMNVRTIDNPAYEQVKQESDKNLDGAKVKIDDAIKALAEQGRTMKTAPAAAGGTADAETTTP